MHEPLPDSCNSPDIRTIVDEIFPHLLRAHETCGFSGAYTLEKLTRFRTHGERYLENMQDAQACRKVLLDGYRKSVKCLEELEARREKISDMKGQITRGYLERNGIGLSSPLEKYR
jgi:hypothetical protein